MDENKIYWPFGMLKVCSALHDKRDERYAWCDRRVAFRKIRSDNFVTGGSGDVAWELRTTHKRLNHAPPHGHDPCRLAPNIKHAPSQVPYYIPYIIPVPF